jgi:hypothetical protein
MAAARSISQSTQSLTKKLIDGRRSVCFVNKKSLDLL